MGDSLYEMSVFAKVVATGSLSAAARDLGVSTAVVSRRLAALEARLGVRLVNRTTRRLALTDEGASYHEACARILGEIEDADAAAAAKRVEPQGLLKVALPASFGHKHIAPLVPPFAARYPKIQLAFSLSDRTVNVIEEGYDLAIRIGELEDSSLAARKLAPNRRVVCASPEYLTRHPEPRTPEDLQHHNCLTTNDLQMNWEYKGPDGKRGAVRVSGRFACDNWEVLREWAMAGLGVALKSTWDVRRQLGDGALVPLLPDYDFGTDVAIYAVYPHRRYLPAKTRVFIDYLAESFGPEPYWDRPVEQHGAKRTKSRATV
ncbi:MAG TPA: LysR family transcriptional regulator [Burkholderiales bacterium]